MMIVSTISHWVLFEDRQIIADDKHFYFTVLWQDKPNQFSHVALAVILIFSSADEVISKADGITDLSVVIIRPSFVRCPVVRFCLGFQKFPEFQMSLKCHSSCCYSIMLTFLPEKLGI